MSLAQNIGADIRSGVRIGSVTISGAAFLAPMAGVTDVGMRRAASRRGAPLTFSEMVAAKSFLSGEAESRLRAENTGVGVNAVQIVGCDANDIAETARALEAAGAELIDINMGCPAKRVSGKLAGSALMRDLDAVERIVEMTATAVVVPVTVKTRLGWDEHQINAVELARRAEQRRRGDDHGAWAHALPVLPRARRIGRRSARWSKRSPSRSSSTATAESLADARAMLAASGASGVMIGRAAIGAPWLVGAIARALATGGPLSAPSRMDRLQGRAANTSSPC